jgi:DNA invertase Pin-like site-specific DNA recombinase
MPQHRGIIDIAVIEEFLSLLLSRKAGSRKQPEAKQQIKELRSAGSRVSAIVKQTGLSKTSVYQALNLGSG